jgi:myo-inositol 2-dehydrogenase/D-chiro-inositol 1-dehydrogenase
MHAELLAHRVPAASLGMVYDPVPEASELVAAALGVPVAASEDELLSNAELDAVAICTSTDTHVPLLIAAADSGKAIFCEKPISLEMDAVDRALAAIEASAARLQIGFNRRFDPAHRYVRDAVAGGALGEVHLVRISSRDPAPPPLSYIAVSGGIFLDMTCHDIDMARFVTGSEVVEVYAQGAVRVDEAIGEAGDLDTAVLTMRHADGCLTVIDNSRQAVYGYDQRVEAFGEHGMATSGNPTAHTATLLTAQGSHGAALPYFFIERYLPSYVLQWEAFCEFVRSGGPSPVTGADGRAPLEVGLAAWQSVREGRPVAM